VNLCRTYARSTNLRFCLGIIITPRYLRKCRSIYVNARITILPLTYTLSLSTCFYSLTLVITCYSFRAVCITADAFGLCPLSQRARVCATFFVAVTHPITVLYSLISRYQSFNCSLILAFNMITRTCGL
jgi:hypothetical protein